MWIIAVILTIAAVALSAAVYQGLQEHTRTQMRLRAKEQYKPPPKKPKQVRLYCPACGCQADMRKSSSFSRREIVCQPWCESCHAWVKNPIRIIQQKGGNTCQST